MHWRLIKLGGSVVTHKAAEPFFVDNVDRLANELAPHSCGVILVHGTGHIGKPYAVKHEFLRDGIIPATKPLLAVEIKSVLRRLNVDIVDSMRRAKIPAYSVEPSDYFMDDYSGFRSPMWQQKLVTQMSLGFMPVFYGDVMPLADGSYKVFSSDVMMEILSRSLQPAQTLFLSDVDGVYAKDKSDEAFEILERIDESSLDDMYVSDKDNADVSGGMKAKVKHAIAIARHSQDCVIASGIKPGVLTALLEGRQVIKTKVSVRPI